MVCIKRSPTRTVLQEKLMKSKQKEEKSMDVFACGAKIPLFYRKNALDGMYLYLVEW